MIITRPLRRLDVRSLALDAPLPFLPTCAGMDLPWPSGPSQNAIKEAGAATEQDCTCGNLLTNDEQAAKCCQHSTARS